MSAIADDRNMAILKEIAREEALAEKFLEKYQETGIPSAEKTFEKHAMIAELLQKGKDADRHAYNRAMIAQYVMEIDTRDLLKCGKQVKRLQQMISEGEFV